MNQLKPDLLLKIENLFTQKKWPIINGLKTLSLYDKFCHRLILLNSEEQDLILELTQKFITIGLKDYLERFYESIFLLGDAVFDSKDNIFVYPLINPYLKVKKSKSIIEDGIIKIPAAKIKSGAFLHYMFETDDWTWITNKFIHDSSMITLKSTFYNKNSLLLLIDDYVGSGKTAVDICEIYLNEEFNGEKIDPHNIKVVCIAAQEQGINHVYDKLGIEVITNIRLKKGLSDHYISDDLIAKIIIMNKLETTIGITEEYNLGYEKSEALISFLNKTPNNTFPVYWWETKSKAAPFPRYNNYKK